MKLEVTFQRKDKLVILPHSALKKKRKKDDPAKASQSQQPLVQTLKVQNPLSQRKHRVGGNSGLSQTVSGRVPKLSTSYVNTNSNRVANAYQLHPVLRLW